MYTSKEFWVIFSREVLYRVYFNFSSHTRLNANFPPTPDPRCAKYHVALGPISTSELEDRPDQNLTYLHHSQLKLRKCIACLLPNRVTNSLFNLMHELIKH